MVLIQWPSVVRILQGLTYPHGIYLGNGWYEGGQSHMETICVLDGTHVGRPHEAYLEPMCCTYRRPTQDPYVANILHTQVAQAGPTWGPRCKPGVGPLYSTYVTHQGPMWHTMWRPERAHMMPMQYTCRQPLLRPSVTHAVHIYASPFGSHLGIM